MHYFYFYPFYKERACLVIPFVFAVMVAHGHSLWLVSLQVKIEALEFVLIVWRSKQKHSHITLLTLEVQHCMYEIPLMKDIASQFSEM